MSLGDLDILMQDLVAVLIRIADALDELAASEPLWRGAPPQGWATTENPYYPPPPTVGRR